jgi:hypothetical protein
MHALVSGAAVSIPIPSIPSVTAFLQLALPIRAPRLGIRTSTCLSALSDLDMLAYRR